MQHYYDPNNYGFDYSPDRIEYELQENEELIGVYGVAGKELSITTFGYIVKVKNKVTE